VPPDQPSQTEDHVAITRLQAAYADGITRRDWEQVAGLFLPGASVTLDLVTRPTIELDGSAEVVRFISDALERFSFFQFVTLNAHVELWPEGDQDMATARVFMCELRQAVGEGERNDAFGLYRDTYRRVEDRWLISARSYRSMAHFPSGDVFPLD
jgi:hypothetical protein